MLKKFPNPIIHITIPASLISNGLAIMNRYGVATLIVLLSTISIGAFYFYLENGLGLSYNDARSHLDIGRRVVEGLKPGLAQLGSVWLPLPHLLMLPTIWSDFMWHSGLSGALQSMISFVATGCLIFYYLKKLNISVLGRVVGVGVFLANINVLYMQSTAMTELLLLATITAACFELLNFFKNERLLNLIKASFWVMLSTLIRYDGWFLLMVATVLVTIYTYKKRGFKAAEARLLFFATVGALGVALWVLWNLLIFKDPLYFIYGPYSAHAQQLQLEAAGNLATKKDIIFSSQVYLHALAYNSNALVLVLGVIGAVVFYFDKKVKGAYKIAALALFTPLVFNILALFMGQSVLFIQGLSGNTWFNVRYGLMLMPTIAIFIGYLISRSQKMKLLIIGVLLFATFFTFANYDAVTIDDAQVGSSQKNVTEVSEWLKSNAKEDGFVLISAASHDAIIFSSGHPMKKFIHEGTGNYWLAAISSPDRWARWIIMRTNDLNDQTFKLLKDNSGLARYDKVGSYPFADIYQLKVEYVKSLNTKESLGPQR